MGHRSDAAALRKEVSPSKCNSPAQERKHLKTARNDTDYAWYLQLDWGRGSTFLRGVNPEIRVRHLEGPTRAARRPKSLHRQHDELHACGHVVTQVMSTAQNKNRRL